MGLLINDVSAITSFTATAGQTVFAFNFRFFDNADLIVTKNGVTLVLGVDYNVAGAGLTVGMQITLTSGAALNDVIGLTRKISIDKTSEFPVTGPFKVASLNT